MKSVLFINYEYPPIGAGAANATYSLANAMVQKGKLVSVVTSAYKAKRGRSNENGVTVYRIPAFRKFIGQSSLIQMLFYIISAMLHLPYIIKREKPEVLVVFFSFPCGPLGYFVRRFWNIPYVLMLRGSDVPGNEPALNNIHILLQPIRKAIYRYSLGIIANSEGLRSLALTNDPGFTIKVVPNGVDTEFFTPPDNKISNSLFTFLYTGRFSLLKNINTLLKAFSICVSSFPESKLILAGDGPETSSLHLQAEKLNITKYVQWIDWCIKEDLRILYGMADCFVFPSFNEGMSNAVLEAMSSGLPVICSDCIGNNELIANELNGFLVAPDNVTEFADKMIYCIKHREVCNELGSAGRKRCHKQFSWNVAAEKLMYQLDAMESEK